MLKLAGEVVAKLSSLGHVENINRDDLWPELYVILYVHNAMEYEYDATSRVMSIEYQEPSFISGYKIIVLLKCYHKPAWRVWIKLYTKPPKSFSFCPLMFECRLIFIRLLRNYDKKETQR